MKKFFAWMFSCCLTIAPIVCGEELCDRGICELTPGANLSAVEGRYAVLSPVGSATVKKITQAPRLDTLDNKTIAVVGGSFMAYVTHPEIKRLIQSHYPSAKVLLLNEIGSAGPWSFAGERRREKEAFQHRLKEHGVDAVISGNGGCGLCTPKEMGSCIAAEYLGIPSVMIAAPGFVEQAFSAAQTAGVPSPRIVKYPGAFAAHSREELIQNTQEILWPQIVDALTKPLTQEELNTKIATPPEDAIAFAGTLEEVQRYFAENSWTDGLPIVPPTQERVREFLQFTDLAADTVIGNLPIAYRKVTVRLVAINGVMAGCPPEFMPILIAFTRAMAHGDFRRPLCSTHAWTPFCWLNGPLARQLEVDCAQGAISVQRNATIGRFINLAMLNLGGYYVKENRMGTFGYLMPWCLAEDEKAALAIGWKPWHMQQGYPLNENTLTAASALSWGNNLTPATNNPKKIMELMAWDAIEKEQFALGSGMPFVYRMVLVTEYVARNLSLDYNSKESLEKALVAAARRPLFERAYANYWGNPGSSFNPNQYPLERHAKKLGEAENSQITQIPPWLAWSDKKTLETVPVMKEGKTAILVTGDASRNKTMCVPSGAFATIKIELPADWDKQMALLGYAPLSSFYLESELQPSQARRRTQESGNGRVRRDTLTEPTSGQGRRYSRNNPRVSSPY